MKPTPTMSSRTLVSTLLICFLLNTSAFQMLPSTLPESVVRCQLDALRDDNMAKVYQYSSPANQKMTGPLERFSQMVHSPPYDPLVGHSKSDVLMIMEYPTYLRCLVRVWNVEGSIPKDYLWQLSRSTEGSYRDCWLVDAVMPLDLVQAGTLSLDFKQQ